MDASLSLLLTIRIVFQVCVCVMAFVVFSWFFRARVGGGGMHITFISYFLFLHDPLATNENSPKNGRMQAWESVC